MASGDDLKNYDELAASHPHYYDDLLCRLSEATGNFPSGGFEVVDGEEIYWQKVKRIDGEPHVEVIEMLGYIQCASRAVWKPVPIIEAWIAIAALHEKVKELQAALDKKD